MHYLCHYGGIISFPSSARSSSGLPCCWEINRINYRPLSYGGCFFSLVLSVIWPNESLFPLNALIIRTDFNNFWIVFSSRSWCGPCFLTTIDHSCFSSWYLARLVPDQHFYGSFRMLVLDGLIPMKCVGQLFSSVSRMLLIWLISAVYLWLPLLPHKTLF